MNDLYAPVNLDQQLEKTAQQYIKTPANFAPANQSFANMLQNPMLFATGGGNVADPSQNRDAAGTAYLGERSNIASTNLATKASFADILANAGSNIGALMAAMTQLRTAQQGSANSALSGVSSFL